ncbi:unnamed protein product [Cochlearia groenlandica]
MTSMCSMPWSSLFWLNRFSRSLLPRYSWLSIAIDRLNVADFSEFGCTGDAFPFSYSDKEDSTFGTEVALIPHDTPLAKESTLEEGELVSMWDKWTKVMAVMVKTQEQSYMERKTGEVAAEWRWKSIEMVVNT